MEVVDIQRVIEQALKKHKDPYMAACNALNAWCEKIQEEPWWTRDSAKLFSAGYLYGRGLEVNGEEHVLQPLGTSWEKERSSSR
jgi:hypothetical protein